jgi:dienelactone hydrolase
MERLFGDPLFQLLTERALTGLPAGSRRREFLATAAQISDGDCDGWYQQWTQAAQQAAASASADDSEGYLVAAAYHRLSYEPLVAAALDPRLRAAFDNEWRCFRAFTRATVPPVEPVEIPFEGTTLPGHLCLAVGPRSPLATLIVLRGEECGLADIYSTHGAIAMRYGYHCLLLDGPGQSRPLIEQGLTVRLDAENVLRPTLDWLLTRPEVDPARVMLVGSGFGGYLALRAAAHEARIAALIVEPGPGEEVAGPLARWYLRRRLWAHGLDSPEAYHVEMKRHPLADAVDHISCPLLVLPTTADTPAPYADQPHWWPRSMLLPSGHQRSIGAALGWLDEVLDGSRSEIEMRPQNTDERVI